MDIQRNGSQPSGKGPTDWFSGTVRIDRLFQANAPARAAGASVTFEPGARTAWHTHPLGQTLILTAGCGRVQREGGPIEEIHHFLVARRATFSGARLGRSPAIRKSQVHSPTAVPFPTRTFTLQDYAELSLPRRDNMKISAALSVVGFEK